MSTILFERRGKIAIITLNRPEKRNAFNNELWQEFTDALVELDSDDRLWVAIITANGPSFCAGSDITELALGTHRAPPGREDWGFAGITKHRFSKPIIAAVDGSVLGGGLELMLACDLAVATEHTIFGFPEPAVGAMAECGVLNIINHIPLKIAMEMLLTCQPISAGRACDIGLLNRVVGGRDALLPAAEEMAETICRHAPLPIRFHKQIADRCVGLPNMYPSPAWEIVAEMAEQLYASEDFAEGTNAFREKRQPVWKGR